MGAMPAEAFQAALINGHNTCHHSHVPLEACQRTLAACGCDIGLKQEQADKAILLNFTVVGAKAAAPEGAATVEQVVLFDVVEKCMDKTVVNKSIDNALHVFGVVAEAMQELGNNPFDSGKVAANASVKVWSKNESLANCDLLKALGKGVRKDDVTSSLTFGQMASLIAAQSLQVATLRGTPKADAVTDTICALEFFAFRDGLSPAEAASNIVTAAAAAGAPEADRVSIAEAAAKKRAEEEDYSPEKVNEEVMKAAKEVSDVT